MNNKDILKFKLTEKIPKLDPDIFKFFERMFLKVLETKIEVENAKFNKEDIPEDLLSVLIKSLLNDFDMMGFSEVKHQDEIILNEYRKKISKITCGEEAKLHVLCMIEELPKLEIGKFNRWLGFIQGYLWTEGIYTIDELREHNIWLKK